ncbi:MAG: beta-propeller domain-containing protein [Actinobacteria bacterium]|nr:beta-propeller domain-containing protein [Actinomycetota bacterium]
MTDERTPRDGELRRKLEQLADRGEPRGAKAVLDAARGGAKVSSLSTLSSTRIGLAKFVPAIAIAASVMLVAGVAAALVTGGNDKGRPTTVALPRTTTSAAPAAAPETTVPIPEVSIPTKLIAASRLVPFDTCGALVSYARSQALKVVGPYGVPGANYGGVALAGGEAASSGPATAPGAASDSSGQASMGVKLPATDGPEAFSQTNNQESAVDEPDTVKTDGKRIFTLAGGKLLALSTEAAPRLLGSLPMQRGTELLLSGNRVIVLGGGGPIAVDSRFAGPAGPYQQPAVGVTVVDVTNPGAMKVTGTLNVDGGYVAARMIDGVARIAFNSAPNVPFTSPQDGTPEAEAQAAAKNKQAVRSSTAANWLPRFTVTDAAGKQRAAGTLTDCGSSYHPPAFSGFGQLSVVTLNADHPEKSNASSVMADGQIVYASPTRMYIASNQWGSVNGQTVQPTMNTLIHVFDISDPAGAHYRVSGQVRGNVLNQFSMSESDGVFRVATTGLNATGQATSESYVTTFGDAGPALVQLGQVGGLGKGERIQAVRFLGALAYVVTFRQTDPLYVVDVSNPSKPVVKGALELLGFSAYLHPIGPGLLLGVGQDATPEGRRAGTQASVFDVTNPAAPRLVQRYLLGDPSSSQVEFDHHAFLYWAPTKLAVIPVQEYGQCTPDGQCGQGFVGALGLRASTAGISEVGRVQHPKIEQQQQACSYPPSQPGQPQPQPAQPDCQPRTYSYTPPIDRSVVVGSHVFTFSQQGMLVSDLGSLAQQAWLPYPQG